MNTAVSTGRQAEMSPRNKARLAGTFFLLTMVMGAFAQGIVSERLVVYGNAEVTAGNILSHEPLFRFGYAVYVVEMACQITMTMLFYDLLKPVSRSGSPLAAIFGLTGCTVKILSRLFFSAPLFVLGGDNYLRVFTPEQLHAVALLLLRVNHQAETIAMVFFGFHTIVKGYLVFRSTFLPRVLGVLSVVAGLGWLTFLYEPLAQRVLPYSMTVGMLTSLAYIVWLIAVGVNEAKWWEQARLAP